MDLAWVGEWANAPDITLGISAGAFINRDQGERLW